jgi:transcriptional regulator with XRE-family HTH domain
LIVLGDRIRELRAEKGWSQEEFAYQCGLHRTYIGHVELGKKNISFESLVTIAAALAIPLSQLFVGLEERAGTTHKRTAAKPMPKQDAATAQGGKSRADVNRLLTELRLQRTLMERVLDTLGRKAGTKHAGAKSGRKRRQ